MALQLVLPEVIGKLLPGRFLLADVFAVDCIFSGGVGPYWPALVVDQSLAPSEVHRRQEATINSNLFAPPEEEYLVWLIGKNRFFWIERSHLRQLHESQLEAIKNSDDKEELTSLFKIGLRQSTAENMEMFGDQVLDDATCINGGDSILTPGTRLDSKVSNQRLKRPFANHSCGRNLRTRLSDSLTSTSSSTSSPFPHSAFARTPSASVSVEAARTPIVKQEPSEDDLLPRKERVQILVGPINTEFTCSKTNITKSPVLSSYVVEHSGQQPFIMNPALKDISPDDFSCVIDFLRTHMYAPALVEAPANRSDSRLYVLEGLAHEWEYSSEIQRCGRLHVLAKKFHLPAMVEYVFKKLTQVRYPKSVMKHGVLLELTKTVFGGDGRKIDRAGLGQEQEQEDPLERYLINKIVEDLETITTWRDSSRLFWEAMHAGKARDLSVKVFRGRAELDEKFPDLIKIEDD